MPAGQQPVDAQLTQIDGRLQRPAHHAAAQLARGAIPFGDDGFGQLFPEKTGAFRARFCCLLNRSF